VARISEAVFVGAAAVAGGCAAITGLGDLHESACAYPSCADAHDATISDGADGDGSVADSRADGVLDEMAVAAEADAPPYQDPGILCGAIDCTAGTEKCCIYEAGAETVCMEAGVGCGVASAALRCDDTADCPSGDLCCVVFVAAGDIDVDCLTSCVDAGPRLCNPRASDCPPGLTCGPEPALPAGYHACQ
jgi:hypothetical protein